MKLKYGLIGKDIAHSLSPKLYRELIDPNINYELIDVGVEEVPTIEELSKKYFGINITSPYKEHFVGKVILTENAAELNAINCIKFKKEIAYGENTDYLAILDILKKKIEIDPNFSVALLGDGVMSRVTERALKKLEISYQVFSRKKFTNFYELDFSQLFSDKYVLIINSCARTFVFNNILPEKGEFWDFNYNYKEHSDKFKNLNFKYEDGYELLKKQAEYAVLFWSN